MKSFIIIFAPICSTSAARTQSANLPIEVPIKKEDLDRPCWDRATLSNSGRRPRVEAFELSVIRIPPELLFQDCATCFPGRETAHLRAKARVARGNSLLNRPEADENFCTGLARLIGAASARTKGLVTRFELNNQRTPPTIQHGSPSNINGQ